MIRKHDKFSWRKIISRLLPNDDLWNAKDKDDGKSVLYRLILGICDELVRVEDLISTIADEYDPQQTTDLLERWESAVGIPDDVFSASGTIEERRENVLLKLRSLNVQSEQDFIDLAALLGFTITIDHGSDNLYPPYDIPHFLVTAPQARFIWYVRSTTPVSESLKNLFFKLKPAHSKLIFLS